MFLNLFILAKQLNLVFNNFKIGTNIDYLYQFYHTWASKLGSTGGQNLKIWTTIAQTLVLIGLINE